MALLAVYAHDFYKRKQYEDLKGHSLLVINILFRTWWNSQSYGTFLRCTCRISLFMVWTNTVKVLLFLDKFSFSFMRENISATPSSTGSCHYNCRQYPTILFKDFVVSIFFEPFFWKVSFEPDRLYNLSKRVDVSISIYMLKMGLCAQTPFRRTTKPLFLIDKHQSSQEQRFSIELDWNPIITFNNFTLFEIFYKTSSVTKWYSDSHSKRGLRVV